jgi:DNA invertase Pin-like site-specific DNA recombinase
MQMSLFRSSKRIYVRKSPIAPSQEYRDKVLEIKTLYEKFGTLQQVADHLGITRERVRQLLKKGESYGLFKYETTRKRNLVEALKKVSKEEFIACIKNGVNRFDICLKFGIDMNIYFKLIDYYQIDTKDYKLEYRYKEYLIRYSNIVDKLGHHPSTTEMQKTGRKDWRYTQLAIARLWGSMDKFRQEYGIEKPPFTFHPNTRKAFREGIERRQAIKREKIENVRNFIERRKSVSLKMIINEFGYSPMSISSYLKELIDNSEIKRLKKRTAYYYLPNI